MAGAATAGAGVLQCSAQLNSAQLNSGLLVDVRWLQAGLGAPPLSGQACTIGGIAPEQHLLAKSLRAPLQAGVCCGAPTKACRGTAMPWRCCATIERLDAHR